MRLYNAAGDEVQLPPLAKPVAEQSRQAALGVSSVTGLAVALVVFTHANEWADGGVQPLHRWLSLFSNTISVTAMVCLVMIMRGPQDRVVRRSKATTEPLPPVVLQRLAAGESLDGLVNIIDGDASFCVRCCVWRRPPPPEPTTAAVVTACLCVKITQRRAVHHCRVCNQCCEAFDHHCGFFGRCIAGSFWHGGGNMRPFMTVLLCGWSAGAVAAASVALRIFYDGDGELLGTWQRRIGALVLMVWVLPTALAILLRVGWLCLQGGVHLWSRANALRHSSGASAEDVVPLTSTAGTAAC